MIWSKFTHKAVLEIDDKTTVEPEPRGKSIKIVSAPSPQTTALSENAQGPMPLEPLHSDRAFLASSFSAVGSLYFMNISLVTPSDHAPKLPERERELERETDGRGELNGKGLKK